MKKMHQFILALIFMTSAFVSFGQRTISGKVTDTAGNPQPGVNVVIKGSANGTVTGADGSFRLDNVKTGDVIVFTLVGYATEEVKVHENTPSNLNVTINEGQYYSEVVVSAMSSESSDWIGATLAYNLDGSDPDNIIAAAKTKINTATKFKGKFRLSTIGNFAKPTGTIDTASLRKNIRSVAQSSQGLSIGLEPLYNIKHTSDLDFRGWATFNYKLNIFGIENDGKKEDVNLRQFRLTTGLELDAFEFDNGGKRIHLGIEGAWTKFSSETYKKIFNEDKNSLYSLEWLVVVPLTGNLGIAAGQTLVKGIKPTFSAGIIVAASK